MDMLTIFSLILVLLILITLLVFINISKKKQDIKNLFTVSVNLCSRCCNTTGDLYARVCVLCQVKNMNVKVSDLMPRGNEARFLVQVWIGWKSL